MGMYTEVLVKARLKDGVTPQELEVLDFLFGHGKKEPSNLPEHLFFNKPGWRAVGRCSSFYHHPSAVNDI